MSDAKIFLLRHGEIDTSYVGRFVGQTDLALSVAGEFQARLWERELSAVPLKKIYCSDLMRSKDTAGIISGSRKLDIQISPQLREINLGEWEGLQIGYVKIHFAEEWRMRGMDMEKYRPPGGESFSDLASRVLPVFNGIVNNAKGNVLVIGHAGVNRIILCHLLGMPFANLLTICQDYGRMNIIELKDGSLRLKAMNITPAEGNLSSFS